MTTQFTDQAAYLLNAAQQGRIPENLKHVAEEAVTKTRDAYDQISLASKANAKVVSDTALEAEAGSKTLGELLVHNTSVNTAAAINAAQAIARAKSIPEAGRLQAEFMRQQFATAAAQTRELFEVSTKIAQRTFGSFTGAVRSFGTRSEETRHSGSTKAQPASIIWK